MSEAPPHRPTMYAKIRTPIRPSIFAPHHAPPLIAPPVASKMWVFHENDANSSTSVAIRSLPPPHAPPHMTWLQSSWYQQNFFILSFSTKMCSLCCTDLIRKNALHSSLWTGKIIKYFFTRGQFSRNVKKVNNFLPHSTEIFDIKQCKFIHL